MPAIRNSLGKISSILAGAAVAGGALSVPLVIVAKLPEHLRASCLQPLIGSARIALWFEDRLVVIWICLAVVGAVAGVLYLWATPRTASAKLDVGVICGLALAGCSAALALTPVVDSTAREIWRAAHPANYEIVLEPHNPYDEPLSEGRQENCLFETLRILSARLPRVGQYHPPHRSGRDQLLVRLHADSEEERERLKRIAQSGYVAFRLVHDDSGALTAQQANRADFQPPAGYETLFLDTQKQGRAERQPLFVKKTPELGGGCIDKAYLQYDPANPSLPRAIQVQLNREASEAFRRLTAENVGRRLAIVLDGKLLCAAEIRVEIPGGRCAISADSFSYSEARDLAAALRGGGLPLPLRVVREERKP